MKLKYLPFSIFPLSKISKGSRIFLGLSKKIKKIFPYIELDVKQSRIELEAEEYISLCLFASLSFFIFLSIICFTIASIAKVQFGLEISPIPISLIGAAGITFFVLLQQINYPRLLKNRRIRNLEGNLLYALRNILVQTSAGVPIFNVFVSIANGDFGEVSIEFKRGVKQMGAGKPQIEVLKELTANNPSTYFRRAMWQLANGMKAGSDIAGILEEIIKTISEEQIVQIRTYGSQLNPIAMFYMLLTVIVPSLSITFLIILASFVGLSSTFTKIIFIFLYSLVTFTQIMFLGIIKSKRPSLMGE